MRLTRRIVSFSAHLDVFAPRRFLHCSNNLGKNIANTWPTGGLKYQNGHAPAGQVLLVLQVLIGGDEDVKLRALGSGNELAILQTRPTAFVCGFNGMAKKRMTKRRRCTLVKQDQHLCDFECASRGMFQHVAGLVQRDAGEPLQKLMNGCAVFEVLEQGGSRYTGATKYPGPAHACRVAFNSST